MVGRVYQGRYEALRLLGEGGMGCVYLARDMDEDEPVVVKVMHDHISSDAKFRERFKRETELMSRLNHPNAVGFVTASTQDDPNGPYVVMEFVPGITIDKLLAHNGRFSPMRMRRILAQFCDVLQAAHAQGIVHCDLKPVNLMVTDPDTPNEKLKVMDFGLAQIFDRAVPAPKKEGSDHEYAVGTPGYMSPEQVRGSEVDQRGDLYSVGVIMYLLLAGRLPFAGATTMEILMAQATGGPPSFDSLGLGDRVPLVIEKLVLACLEDDVARRPQSAAELGAAYEAALAIAYGGADTPAPGGVAEKSKGAKPADEVKDRDAVVERLEAWMPEQIALFKLKGFAEAVDADVVESVPGKIRMRPKKASAITGFFSRLGLAKKQDRIEIELQMKKKQDDKQRNMLEILVLLRPEDGSKVPETPDFLDRCAKIFQILKSYLMG